MKTTQIRIELPEDAYQLIIEDQQKRRGDLGKKISLNDLALEYFMVGLQTKLSGLENTIDNGLQHNLNLPTIIMVKEKSLELAQKEQQLVQKEINIRNQEKQIDADRAEFRCQEQYIREQMQNLYEIKDDTAEEKEKVRQLRTENVEQIVNTKILTIENERKDEEIRNLNTQVTYLEEKVFKMLAKFESKLDQKSDKNVWTDYVLPILPMLISVIGFYFTNKKISNNKQKFPIQGELGDVYQKLSPEDQNKLEEKLRDVVDKNFKPLKK